MRRLGLARYFSENSEPEETHVVRSQQQKLRVQERIAVCQAKSVNLFVTKKSGVLNGALDLRDTAYGE